MFDLFPKLVAQSALDKLGVADYSLMGYWCIALCGIGYVALQYGMLRNRAIAVVGAVFLAAAALLSTWHQVSSLDTLVLVLFFGLAGMGCISFVTFREPVYAALGFATAVLSSCGVLFMQHAYFVSAATMIVYAGATIIIFLFVLMFAQHERLQTYDLRLNAPVLSAIVCAVLFAVIYYGILNSNLVAAELEALQSRPGANQNDPAIMGSTSELGRGLYTDYLFTVEIAGTLLLVATIGAIGVAARSNEMEAQ